jgi:hypothetical protein
VEGWLVAGPAPGAVRAEPTMSASRVEGVRGKAGVAGAGVPVGEFAMPKVADLAVDGVPTLPLARRGERRAAQGKVAPLLPCSFMPCRRTAISGAP